MDMTREVFIERFVAHMLRTAGPSFDDGTSIEGYARDIASTYWDDEAYREDGPEVCADSDMLEWGDGE